MTKSGREIMEIFEAFDLTGTAWSAAQLAGCDAKTVAQYVAVREAGGDPLAGPRPLRPLDRDRSSSSRANRSQMRSRSAAGIPGPSSDTDTTTCWPSCRTDSSTTLAAYRGALSTRLLTTRVSCVSSPRTNTRST